MGGSALLSLLVHDVRRLERHVSPDGYRVRVDEPTLYEWAGGGTAIRRMIDCFYDRVERDELLGPLFPGGVSEEHRANVTLWWGEVFGGPPRYTDG